MDENSQSKPPHDTGETTPFDLSHYAYGPRERLMRADNAAHNYHEAVGVQFSRLMELLSNGLNGERLHPAARQVLSILGDLMVGDMTFLAEREAVTHAIGIPLLGAPEHEAELLAAQAQAAGLDAWAEREDGEARLEIEGRLLPQNGMQPQAAQNGMLPVGQILREMRLISSDDVDATESSEAGKLAANERWRRNRNN